MSALNTEVNSTAYQINIEKVVLSSIFFDYEILEELNEKVKECMFYLPAHQEVYRVLLELYKEGLPIDEEFVRTRVHADKINDTFLIELLSVNPISNIKAYTDELVENFRRRELETISIIVKKAIHEDCRNSDAISDLIYQKLTEIETSDIKSTDVKTARELREELKNLTKIERLPTHILWMDSTFDGGIKLGNFVFWSGKKETGKTTMAIQIHENMAMNGVKVGVLPMEFGTRHYLESLDEKYPHSDNKKKEAILDNMILEDRFNDIGDIEKQLKKMAKKGVKSVLIDSQIRITNAGLANTTKAERLADIFSRLGIITQKYLMTIHIIVQTSKADHDSEEISVKGCIDADHEASIWFHIKKQASGELRDIVIAKNKQNSKRPKVTVKFNPVTKEFKKVNDETKEGIPIHYEDMAPTITEYGSNDPVLPKDQGGNFNIPENLL